MGRRGRRLSVDVEGGEDLGGLGETGCSGADDGYPFDRAGVGGDGHRSSL